MLLAAWCVHDMDLVLVSLNTGHWLCNLASAWSLVWPRVSRMTGLGLGLVPCGLDAACGQSSARHQSSSFPHSSVLTNLLVEQDSLLTLLMVLLFVNHQVSLRKCTTTDEK